MPRKLPEASWKYFPKYQTLDLKFIFMIHSNNLCPKTIPLSVRITFMAQGAGSCITTGTAGHAERSGKIWEQFHKSSEAFRKLSGSKTVLEGPWPTRRPGASHFTGLQPASTTYFGTRGSTWDYSRCSSGLTSCKT